jgi:undecaprenyl-diphosphatase
VNGFDRSVLLGISQFTHRVRWLDEVIGVLNRSALFKGGVVLSSFWWLWFAPRTSTRQVRGALVASLAGGFIALIVGRVLALLLPFRVRPLHNPSLGFVPPYGTGAGELRGWSSFPSDHAMMYAALAVGFWYVSKRAGLFLAAWTVVVICLPRLYCGQHYPTDIVAGLGIGALIGMLVQRARIRDRLAEPVLIWSERHPGSCYASLFLLTVGIATMFLDVRELLKIAVNAVKGTPD